MIPSTWNISVNCYYSDPGYLVIARRRHVRIIISYGITQRGLLYGYFIKWQYDMETFSTLLAIGEGIHRSPVDYPPGSQWVMQTPGN